MLASQMSSAEGESWSDSDNEQLNGEETSVLLGVPDGLVQDCSDLVDAAVSRIGGRPAFLTSTEPSITCCWCKNCSHPMELLSQIWCPLEGSAMDRALYVWGCARASCQRKEGSIRAWRGLRFNAAYAEKLTQKIKPLRNTDSVITKKLQTFNPFSVHPQQACNNPGVTIDNLFAATSTPEGDDDVKKEFEQIEDIALVTTSPCANVHTSTWIDVPSYPPIYLSTMQEHIPSPSVVKHPAEAQIQDSGDNKDWTLELFETSLNVDPVFERFARRVGYEGQQCIRYELNGTPLPFASDSVFERLFPALLTAPPPVTKASFTILPAARRTLQLATIPVCAFCGSRRIFECQMMPNLINVVMKSSDNPSKDKKTKGSAEQGMEWGTCMIFTCERDCTESDEKKDVWREEVVVVQWDQ